MMNPVTAGVQLKARGEGKKNFEVADIGESNRAYGNTLENTNLQPVHS
jgi:hypothetical protein